MATLTYTDQLTVIECCACHMNFAVAQSFEQERRRDHRNFYCPAGHTQHFPGKSDLELEREERARAERLASLRLASLDQVRAERDHLEHVVRAEKGAKTKLKKRIAAGVCPCCNRSFANVARHMAGQHPEYPKETAP